MEELPEEVMSLVLAYVGQLMWPSCQFVCCRWRQLICPCTNRVYRDAASGGHVHVMDWLLQQGRWWWESEATLEAAAGGHLAALQWIIDHHLHLDTRLCEVAAERGQLAVLRWAHQNGILHLPGENVLHKVILRGHLDVMVWLCERGYKWSSDACADAAYGGHLEVLKWLHSRGCKWDASTCAEAAGQGHLEVLKYARSHGCPWDEEVAIRAAEGGHLEILQWARENGCDWDEDEIYQAAEDEERYPILRWLRDCNQHKKRK